MSLDPSCAKNRKVETCSKCVRYQECLKSVRVFANEIGVEKLGMAILLSLAEDYVDCWRKGYMNYIHSYEQILNSQYPTIMSNGKFDGIPIMEGLRARCEREFGSLEETNRKMKLLVNKKISVLVEKRKQETSKAKKFDLTNKINKLKGELNY